jgi:hypothetical protein
VSDPRDAAAEARLVAWAECVRRLLAVAPLAAVAEETGVRGGHTTPTERKALRGEAQRVVDGWLLRDLAALRSPDPADA